MNINNLVGSILHNPEFYNIKKALPADWEKGIRLNADKVLQRLFSTGPIVNNLHQSQDTLTTEAGTSKYEFQGDEVNSKRQNNCGRIEIIKPAATGSDANPDPLREYSGPMEWLHDAGGYSSSGGPIAYYTQGVSREHNPYVVMKPTPVAIAIYDVYFIRKFDKAKPDWKLIDERWAGQIVWQVLKMLQPSNMAIRDEANRALKEIEGGVVTSDRSDDRWRNFDLERQNYRRNMRRKWRGR